MISKILNGNLKYGITMTWQNGLQRKGRNRGTSQEPWTGQSTACIEDEGQFEQTYSLM